MTGRKAKASAKIEEPRKEARGELTEYYFSFELIKQYPHVRSFIVKAPLKRSIGDTFSELLGGSKKGAYRV
ncbi:MAG: hypothetical protein AB1295_01790 [Candidatus Micrarchaeota archaeon]